MEQLTSPTTSYGAIKYFAENAGTGIHPCVVVEIVLKWWSVRTDREHVNMSFITPLITPIQNVSSKWYNSVYWDERYKSLIKTLDIPERTATCYMCYRIWGNSYNERILDDCISNHRNLEDCISKGDGTPAQLKDLYCTDNMERYEHIMHLAYVVSKRRNFLSTDRVEKLAYLHGNLRNTSYCN